ncbi:MAG: hypothetical protein ACI4UF_05620 [Thermoguttaceae bacterium]
MVELVGFIRPIPNTKPVALQTFYLNTDLHGFNGLKVFHFMGLKLKKTLENPFK